MLEIVAAPFVAQKCLESPQFIAIKGFPNTKYNSSSVVYKVGFGIFSHHTFSFQVTIVIPKMILNAIQFFQRICKSTKNKLKWLVAKLCVQILHNSCAKIWPTHQQKLNKWV